MWEEPRGAVAGAGLDAKLGFVAIPESSQGRRCWLWGRSRGISSCHFPEHLSWAIPAEDSATLTFRGHSLDLCSLPGGEGKGTSSCSSWRKQFPQECSSRHLCVSPTLCHLAQELAGAWKCSPAGQEPGRGCNPAPCWGCLGSEDIPLIKMFIELLQTLTRQRCKSGISTRCVELYSRGSREAGSPADCPQRNASHKRRQHPERGRGCSGSSVVTLSYERFLQEKVQISFCQGRLEADW